MGQLPGTKSGRWTGLIQVSMSERQEGLLKTDKREALSLANLLYNQLEKGIQVGDPLQAVRRLVPPTEAAAALRGMVRHHYELVSESTQRKNKLTSICDKLFPEFTRLLRNPNLPTALALGSRFPTTAELTMASFEELRQARGRSCSVSDAKLLELQRLAAQIRRANPTADWSRESDRRLGRSNGARSYSVAI
jgi:hypothetical protein